MKVRSHALMVVVAVVTCLGMPIEAAERRLRVGQTNPSATTVPEGDHYRVDMEFDQIGNRVTMRRYIDGARSRMETVVDGQTIITITLGDTAGTTYTVMPKEKRAMKMTMTGVMATVAQAGVASSTPAADDPPMELVGTETINGKPTRKYRVQAGGSDGLLWLEVGREVPLRMESGGVRVDMKNYDFAPVPGELFEVPRGYEVVDIDELMRQSASAASASNVALRGAVGAAGARAGGAVGSHFGAIAGASIGGALGGPIGAMIGKFLGERFGRKAGQKAGAAVGGVIR